MVQIRWRFVNNKGKSEWIRWNARQAIWLKSTCIVKFSRQLFMNDQLGNNWLRNGKTVSLFAWTKVDLTLLTLLRVLLTWIFCHYLRLFMLYLFFDFDLYLKNCSLYYTLSLCEYKQIISYLWFYRQGKSLHFANNKTKRHSIDLAWAIRCWKDLSSS